MLHPPVREDLSVIQLLVQAYNHPDIIVLKIAEHFVERGVGARHRTVHIEQLTLVVHDRRGECDEGTEHVEVAILDLFVVLSEGRTSGFASRDDSQTHLVFLRVKDRHIEQAVLLSPPEPPKHVLRG